MGINDPVVPNESQQKKDKLRDDLERQIKEYLKSGGKIKNQPTITKTLHKKKPQR
jgi:hypothetical protein